MTANIEEPQKPKEDRTWHRPISINVEGVRPMPHVRDLPADVQLTINLRGDRLKALMLIKELAVQVLIDDFFAIEITGPS